MDKAAMVPLAQAYRLINPGCVVLVSVGDGERDNLFAVTWNMPVRKNPAILALLSGKSHFSYPFIERTGQFGINIPDASLVDAVYGCGTTTGRDLPDKFGAFGLTRVGAVHIKAPLVKEALATLECQVQQIVELGPSALIIARILRAVASADHFKDGHWTFENGLRLLHHLSGDRFCTSEDSIGAKSQ